MVLIEAVRVPLNARVTTVIPEVLMLACETAPVTSVGACTL